MSVLHILNGDAVLPSMQESGLPGDFRVWGDVLWEGPLQLGVEWDEGRDARAWYFATSDQPYEEMYQTQMRWNEALKSAPSYQEVVIWLEHDLHDQFQLIHHLAWFSLFPHPRLSLICIGEFPGVMPFHGLGQLNGSQLASLYPRRRPVSSEQLKLGRRTWDGLISSKPLDLFEIWQGNTSILPFLAGALQRFFEEYPSTKNGLSRTETTILELVAQSPIYPRDIFPALAQREERVFMGDMSFYGILGRIGHGEHKLVELGADNSLRDRTEITAAGREVLQGRKDRIELLGIERWLGGVHLQGHKVPWRWDPATRRMLKVKQ